MSPSYDRARGATWGIWDLHVHTPASMVGGYGGDTDEAWERFIVDLENLPSDFRAVGINDYWFLDGYRRVRAERAKGRISNLEAVFPVVELRLDQFGGVDGSLKRANYHVIFDPELDPDVIDSQFLSALTSSVELSPEAPSGSWSGTITRESLTDLGARIRASLPPGVNPGTISDLLIGFNNLNVPTAELKRVLANSYVKDRHVTAVGRPSGQPLSGTNSQLQQRKLWPTQQPSSSRPSRRRSHGPLGCKSFDRATSITGCLIAATRTTSPARPSRTESATARRG